MSYEGCLRWWSVTHKTIKLSYKNESIKAWVKKLKSVKARTNLVPRAILSEKGRGGKRRPDIALCEVTHTVELPLTATSPKRLLLYNRYFFGEESMYWLLFKSLYDGHFSTMATSLPWQLSSVPKVAVLERFNCSLILGCIGTYWGHTWPVDARVFSSPSHFLMEKLRWQGCARTFQQAKQIIQRIHNYYRGNEKSGNNEGPHNMIWIPTLIKR